MAEHRPRVLLVSHETSRTGAPRVAVDVARILRDAGYEVVTVLRIGGPLAAEFRDASDRVVREPLTWVRVLLRRFRRTRRAATWLEQRAARRVLRRERPALAYLNTVKAACYVRPASAVGVPVVLHVHEVEPLASSTLERYDLDGAFESLGLIACSEAVRDNLAGLTGEAQASITVAPSCVDTERLVRLARAPSGPTSDARREPIVVGACGTTDHRKGSDLWLAMAARVRAVRPDLSVRFQWVGRGSSRLAEPAARLGITDRVELVDEVSNPYPILASMDVFTLPSRADAFPLVVLEAMALGRPVVGFALPGVIAQLGDAGVVVPEGDVEAMADAVIGLLDDPERRRDLGTRAAQRVRSHFDLGKLREPVLRVVTDALTTTDRP